jgi:hypothetical protein
LGKNDFTWCRELAKAHHSKSDDRLGGFADECPHPHDQPWLRFRPQEAARLHHESRAFLTEILATPFNGPTVVVTHHAPHWEYCPVTTATR